jgi:hypothetical protein
MLTIIVVSAAQNTQCGLVKRMVYMTTYMLTLTLNLTNTLRKGKVICCEGCLKHWFVGQVNCRGILSKVSLCICTFVSLNNDSMMSIFGLDLTSFYSTIWVMQAVINVRVIVQGCGVYKITDVLKQPTSRRRSCFLQFFLWLIDSKIGLWFVDYNSFCFSCAYAAIVCVIPEGGNHASMKSESRQP